MVKDIYWVVSADQIIQATTHGPSTATTFNNYRGAEIFKAGLEVLNPGKRYAIIRRIPERYEQASLITGEKERSDY